MENKNMKLAFNCIQIDEMALKKDINPVDLIKAIKIYADNKFFFERIVSEVKDSSDNLMDTLNLMVDSIIDINEQFGIIKQSDIEFADRYMITNNIL